MEEGEERRGEGREEKENGVHWFTPQVTPGLGLEPAQLNETETSATVSPPLLLHNALKLI